jgi:hypothetical protein
MRLNHANLHFVRLNHDFTLWASNTPIYAFSPQPRFQLVRLKQTYPLSTQPRFQIVRLKRANLHFESLKKVRLNDTV